MNKVKLVFGKGSLLVALVLASLLFTSCTAPEVVEKEVIITQIVEETIMVEGTPQIVEVEVTKIVEREVVVTATPSSVEDAQIVIGQLADAQTLNPVLAGEAVSGWAVTMLFDPLIGIDPHSKEPLPRLATHWDISDDGLTYTFYLRQDARWQDGEPVTAADVEFALLSMLAPDYTGPSYSAWNSLVGAEQVHEGTATECDGIKVIDDHTISLSLIEPSAPFLVNSVGGRFPLIPLPKHILDGQDLLDNPFNYAPIGNGPYKFVSWKVGNELVMEANPDWWGGEPRIKKVISRVIPDSQTLVVALEAGEIDVTIYALPTVADRLREKEHLKVSAVPFARSTAVVYNLQHPVLQDLAVRKAIAHGVDLVTFADAFLLGLGQVAITSASPGHWAENTDLELREYNPELASQILEEAGWVDTDGDGIREKDGVRARIVCETNAGNVLREDFCTFAQAQLKQIGIDWACEFKEWAVIVERVLGGGYEALIPSWTGINIDPHELYEGFHSAGSQNTTGFNNAEVDRLLEAGRVTVDQAERKRIYDRVQAIVYEELPQWDIWYRPYIDVLDRKFDGPWIRSSGVVTGNLLWNLYEWQLVE